MEVISPNIPAELKDRDQWVVWKSIPAGEGKKPKKIPFNARSGEEAESNNPATWCDYGTALMAYIEQPDRYAGIGYVLTEFDPFVGIDCDDCIIDGNIEPWATALHATMGCTYAEISQSGQGFKMIVRGTIPSSAKPQKAKIPTDIIPADQQGRIEMYADRRFFALTGNILPTASRKIVSVNGELTELHAKLKPQQQLPTNAPAPQRVAPDGSVDAFTRAWVERVERTAVEAVRSAVAGERHNVRVAQARLLGGLVAHGLMDETYAADVLFRAQPPVANVMQELNAIYAGIEYGKASPLPIPTPDTPEPIFIDGVAHCPTHHTPLRRASNSNGWLCKPGDDLCFWWKGEGYSAPQAVPAPAPQAAPAGTPPPDDDSTPVDIHGMDIPEHMTDTGNAQRMIRLFGKDVRHSGALGFLVWDGACWQKDESGIVVRMAQQTALSIYAEAQQEEDEDVRKALLKHARHSENLSGIHNMTTLLGSQEGVTTRMDQFDSNDWLLNAENGIVDLTTGALLSHNRSELMTKKTPAAYNPNATCPTWLTFLDRIFAGDAEMIGYIQRMMGYCLTGSIRAQVMFIAYGSGANGKSVFVNILDSLLGSYATTADPSTFIVQEKDKIRSDLARLAGARFVSTVELDEGRRLSESLIKRVTGDDVIVARFLQQNEFSFTPKFKLLMATNHAPVIRNNDYAIWRRIRLIPFDVTIPPEERDEGLTDKLKLELPGILAWAVQGCLAWQKDGLKEPQKVLVATETYRSNMDLIGQFMEDYIIKGAAMTAPCADVYKAYTSFCEDGGERPMSQRAFGIKMSERGFVNRDRIRGAWHYLGMGLLDK